MFVGDGFVADFCAKELLSQGLLDYFRMKFKVVFWRKLLLVFGLNFVAFCECLGLKFVTDFYGVSGKELKFCVDVKMEKGCVFKAMCVDVR